VLLPEALPQVGLQRAVPRRAGLQRARPQRAGLQRVQRRALQRPGLQREQLVSQRAGLQREQLVSQRALQRMAKQRAIQRVWLLPVELLYGFLSLVRERSWLSLSSVSRHPFALHPYLLMISLVR